MKGSSNQTSLPLKARVGFWFILACLVFFGFFLTGEMLLRFFDSQQYLYPRWAYSPGYGTMLYQNQKMVEARPGHYKFIYTINEYQYRGKQIPISNKYLKKNIVVLGDSYTFGHGVEDGQEYAAVMARLLDEEYNVINLGVGGWGLTQQIRRFYEFGQLYSPKHVVLMFCSNDPFDNFRNRVTRVEKGRFIFQSSDNRLNWIKQYLSRSIIQKSQLYNYVKARAYSMFMAAVKTNKEEPVRVNGELEKDDKIQYQEKDYIALLEAFANDLNSRGINFILTSVPKQLDKFQGIKNKVNTLETQGLLNYIESDVWFQNNSGYQELISPEGHPGKDWHLVIGRHLAAVIENADEG